MVMQQFCSACWLSRDMQGQVCHCCAEQHGQARICYRQRKRGNLSSDLLALKGTQLILAGRGSPVVKTSCCLISSPQAWFAVSEANVTLWLSE